jgi:aryl-alcohol dehydrogenase-like predicted oxidoreductase
VHRLGTLDALNDVVRSGKVRYIGASSLWAWEFCKALYLQKMSGWAPFVSIQGHYNLLDREEEREVYPLCADQDIGVMPWSPLAGGKLTRDCTGRSWSVVSDQDVSHRVRPSHGQSPGRAGQCRLPNGGSPALRSDESRRLDQSTRSIETNRRCGPCARSW